MSKKMYVNIFKVQKRIITIHAVYSIALQNYVPNFVYNTAQEQKLGEACVGHGRGI